MPDLRLPLCPEVQQGLGSSGFWIWRGIVEKGKWDLAFLELMEAKHIVTARESFVFLRIPDSRAPLPAKRYVLESQEEGRHRTLVLVTS